MPEAQEPPSAIATGGFFLGALLKLYALAVVALLVTAATFFLWARSSEPDRLHPALPVGRGVSLPVHRQVADPPSKMALQLTLVADGVLFSSLIFGLLFLWLAAPYWPPPAVLHNPWPAVLVAAGAWCAAAGCAWRASRRTWRVFQASHAHTPSAIPPAAASTTEAKMNARTKKARPRIAPAMRSSRFKPARAPGR